MVLLFDRALICRYCHRHSEYEIRPFMSFEIRLDPMFDQLERGNKKYAEVGKDFLNLLRNLTDQPRIVNHFIDGNRKSSGLSRSLVWILPTSA